MYVKDQISAQGSISQLWNVYEVDIKQLCSPSIHKYKIKPKYCHA